MKLETRPGFYLKRIYEEVKPVSVFGSQTSVLLILISQGRATPDEIKDAITKGRLLAQRVSEDLGIDLQEGEPDPRLFRTCFLTTGKRAEAIRKFEEFERTLKILERRPSEDELKTLLPEAIEFVKEITLPYANKAMDLHFETKR